MLCTSEKSQVSSLLPQRPSTQLRAQQAGRYRDPLHPPPQVSSRPVRMRSGVKFLIDVFPSERGRSGNACDSQAAGQEPLVARLSQLPPVPGLRALLGSHALLLLLVVLRPASAHHPRPVEQAEHGEILILVFWGAKFQPIHNFPVSHLFALNSPTPLQLRSCAFETTASCPRCPSRRRRRRCIAARGRRSTSFSLAGNSKPLIVEQLRLQSLGCLTAYLLCLLISVKTMQK